MSRRVAPSRVVLASRRLQARIKSHTAALTNSIAAAEAMTSLGGAMAACKTSQDIFFGVHTGEAIIPKSVSQPAPPLDLDAMDRAARDRLSVHIHTSALLHSAHFAREFAGIHARANAAINRRNAAAALILKHFHNETYWACCGPTYRGRVSP